MAVVTVTAWRCDFPTCGHVWYSEKEPLRCSKCKRKNWNKVKGDVVRAPKTRKRKPAGKGTAKPVVLGRAAFAAISQVENLELSPEGEQRLRDSEGLPQEDRRAEVIKAHTPEYRDVIGVPIEELTNTVTPDEPLPAAVIVAPVLETIVRQPTAAKYREILKQLAAPEHKIGEKCPHGWANWLQCPKCNQR